MDTRISVYTPIIVFYKEKWPDKVIQTNRSQQSGIFTLPTDILFDDFLFIKS